MDVISRIRFSFGRPACPALRRRVLPIPGDGSTVATVRPLSVRVSVTRQVTTL